MKKYDAIVVLGSQPDFRNWLFPSHTYKSLDRALELYKSGVAPYICLSGDHSLRYDNTGITQPFKECDKAEEYLVNIGCPPEIILKEGESRDTISNFYYLKNLVFKPNNIKNILLITTSFRRERINYIWKKILGPDYKVTIETVDFTDNEIYKNDSAVLKKHSEFLNEMIDGDDTWLKNKFYNAQMYVDMKNKDQAETDPVKRFLI